MKGWAKIKAAPARKITVCAEYVKGAPHSLPVRRLDDVRAAKQLDLTWKSKEAT
jgi:hypothetical protein